MTTTTDPTIHAVQALEAGMVVGNDGSEIGRVGQVYTDNDTGQPSWVTVKTGWFGSNESFYLGGRYLTLKGQMISKVYSDQNVNRSQIGGGWFVTPNILAKLEYVNQKYNDFPVTDIRYGGKFNGFMISGAVGF